MLGAGIPLHVEIHEVRPSLIEAFPATVLLGRCDGQPGPSLALQISNREAHALLHEMSGRETERSAAMLFAMRVASAFNGRAEAVLFRSAAPGIVRASVRFSAGGRPVDIQAEPGHCLGLAITCSLPILCDGDLLESIEPEDPRERWFVTEIPVAGARSRR